MVLTLRELPRSPLQYDSEPEVHPFALSTIEQRQWMSDATQQCRIGQPRQNEEYRHHIRRPFLLTFFLDVDCYQLSIS